MNKKVVYIVKHKTDNTYLRRCNQDWVWDKDITRAIQYLNFDAIKNRLADEAIENREPFSNYSILTVELQFNVVAEEGAEF